MTPQLATPSQVKLLNCAEAKELTARIKTAVEGLYVLVVEAHEGEAWKALGYKSWKEYVKAEFAMSESYSHRLLNFGKVQKALADSPIGKSVTPKRESQVRKLAGKKKRVQQAAWKEAVTQSGGQQPTAKQVEEAVNKVESAGDKSQGTEQGAQPEDNKRDSEPAEKQEERPAKSTRGAKYVPSNGLQYAEQAIISLEKIQSNDTERDAAFDRVTQWIASHK